MVKVGRPPQDPARQLERAHRILDAAAELIERWGYDKTTIDDVARRAGVAKGTIYLHWKTRDELFAALLRRERAHMLEEVRERAPATLRDLVGELAAELVRRPLMQAVLLGDSEVLGKLTRRKRRGESGLDLGAAFEEYLGELRELGAVRADRTPPEQFAVLGAVIYGFLHTRDIMPEAMRTPDDRLVELIAETAGLALGTGTTPSGPASRAIGRATAGYLDTMVEIARHKLATSLGS
ncbi:helix-turn-helix domain-containing protein [Nonomuraea sp. NPDC048916]|uniref:TetR/AcrR family transcriptional regulator n=1 Tax=Nonomuraea sp. NPDC048916 TaxID=3154232 RepID=UPI0033F2B659